MKRWAGLARFGGVGDNLISASVLRPLKRLGYMTEVITSATNASVFFNNPFLDKLSIKDDVKDLPQGDANAWQRWFDSRAKEYDLFLHASHSCEGRHALFTHMTGFWWPEDYRRRMCGGSYLETVHDIIGVPHEFGPLFFPTDEEMEFAARIKSKVGRCIVWIVSGTRIDKIYPYATFAIARVVKELGIPVVVMGGPSDREMEMVMTIRETVRLTNGSLDGLLCAVPEKSGEKCWPLRSALTFAVNADMLVSPDTGPAWACAFVPMPKIIMVSHASAENITKHWINTTTLHADPQRVPCWPCHRLHNDQSTCVPNKENTGAACISDISVERMVQAVSEKWQRPAAAAAA